MICPLRSEAPFIPAFLEGREDEWQDRGGQRCCSYCGSLHPDDFMREVAAGVELGPTDKNYKVYVHSHPTAEGGKFYFQHLSAEQQGEFVRLLNAWRVRFGVPGNFYVRPFFVGRR